MKKIVFAIIATLFLNGCFQAVAFVPSIISGAATGKIAESTLTYALSHGVKNHTGKTVFEHVLSYSEHDKRKVSKIEKNEELLNSFYPVSLF